MGDYVIIIAGTGPHHNTSCESDADKIAKDTVEALKKKGHIVKAATFWHSSTSGHEELI